MKTGLKVFLMILSLVIAGGTVIGVDVYLSYQSFNENSTQFDLTYNYTVSTTNETIVFNATILSPKLGFIPKKAKVTVIVEKNYNQYNNPQEFSIKIGEVLEIEYIIQLATTEIDAIEFGVQVVLTVKISVVPIYIGIPLNFLTKNYERTLLF